MATYTPNLNLKKPAAEDFYNIEDSNANMDLIDTAVAAKAPLASPTLTGAPTAPTADADTNTTQLATTAFVVGQAGASTPTMDGTGAVGTSKKYARQDHVHPTDTSRAAATDLTAHVTNYNAHCLTANKTVYIAVTGSDTTGDGTSGNPFLTYAHAISVQPRNLNGYGLTFSFGAGTYTEVVTVSGFYGGYVSLISTSGITDVITGGILADLGSEVRISNVDILYNASANYSLNANSMVIARHGSVITLNTNITIDCSLATSKNGICAREGSCLFSAGSYAVAIENSDGYAVYANAGIITLHGVSGLSNYVGFKTVMGGKITFDQNYNALEATTLYEFSDGGTINGVSGRESALPASSGTMEVIMDGGFKNLTPTGNCTFNASKGIPGQTVVFVFTTSGTTSYTLTFGTNFKSTGTLATGTVSGKVFTITFICAGVVWNEVARTVAM